MSQPVTRRTFVASALAMALSIPVLTREVAAQAGTPAAGGLAQLGLPELKVTTTKTGFEGIASSMAAGRYLLSASGEPDTAVAFVQPTGGMTVDDFLGFLKGMGQASPASGGTPSSGSDSQGGQPPAFFYDFLLAGGAAVAPGATTQAVIDLTPGDWFAWGDDPTSPLTPVKFTVTGTIPASLPEPKANATITFSDFAINITDGSLVSGDNVIKLVNGGAQPHFLVLMKGPDGMTKDDVKGALDAEMTGTPAAGGLNPQKDLMPILGTESQSKGTMAWAEAKLDPGTYVGLCFFPDKDSGMPHAYMGMYNVFTVA